MRLLCFLFVALISTADAGSAVAQAVPSNAVRFCLRNVTAIFTCYVIGRAGELVVDGALSNAWAKIVDVPKSTGDKSAESKGAVGKTLPPTPPSGTVASKPLLPFGNSGYATVDILNSGDLDSLSARLLRQGLTTADPKAKPVDGFIVLPGQVPGSLNRPVIGTPLDITRPSDLAARLNTLKSPVTLEAEATTCRTEREVKLGLSYLQIYVTTSGDETATRLARRQKEVVEYCARRKPY